MKKFRIVEHTADVGLVAYGNTLAEAFANSACGLFSIMVDLRTVRRMESRTLKIAADNSEALLQEWLNNLIYIFDVEMLLFKQFEIILFDENSLTAICHGEKCDISRHQIKLGVKAATYHMLKVDKINNRVRVIFDI